MAATFQPESDLNKAAPGAFQTGRHRGLGKSTPPDLESKSTLPTNGDHICPIQN